VKNGELPLQEDVSLQDIEAYTWNAMQHQMCSATVSYIREIFRDAAVCIIVASKPWRYFSAFMSDNHAFAAKA
jgi:hypothetical protein